MKIPNMENLKTEDLVILDPIDEYSIIEMMPHKLLLD